MSQLGVTAPALLEAEHDCSVFLCQHSVLTDWLRSRALKSQKAGSAKTYVVCNEGQVVGYYALATGSIEHESVSAAFRQNMPRPIPMLVLGRLAVDSAWQRQGIGPGLLKDAVQRAMAVVSIVGCRGILCHAIDEKAKDFYLRHGFVQSPKEPMTVLLSLKM